MILPTYKQELQNELKTFKEIYITHLSNFNLKDMAADIIKWIEEEIARDERIERYVGNSQIGSADKKFIINYP